MSNQSEKIDNFNAKAAKRIGLVTVLVAMLSAASSWQITRESFEEGLIHLAYEESEHIDHALLSGAAVLDSETESRIRSQIQGGLFDIAEVYDGSGIKVLEWLTDKGESIENSIPQHHSDLQSLERSYESFNLASGEWILRVIVPLGQSGGQLDKSSGYFEGVRIVPDWQKDEILQSAALASLIAALASILCGLILYPIVVRLSETNRRKTLEILDSHISMMEALGRAIAKRDSDTGAHNYRVAWIAAVLAEEVGYQGDKMQSLIAGSFLHDVGKIGISDQILLKPGKLTDDEYEIMKTHVNLGADIVNGMGWLSGAHEIVAGHHEKWDGSGYPAQLRGNAIPKSARIFAIADVYDALSSERPYKSAMPLAQVLEILEQGRGSHFDPGLLSAFFGIAGKISATLSNLDESQCRSLLETKIKQHFAVAD